MFYQKFIIPLQNNFASIRGFEKSSLLNSKPDLIPLKEVGSLLSREINVKYASEKQFLNGLASNDPLMAEVVASHVTLKGIDNMCGVLWRKYARREILAVVP